MVKYRRLTQNELEELKDDFIKFLASQSISADDWESWKSKNVEKVDDLIDLFSDIVLEKILSEIDYLEILAPMEVKIFSMGDQNARMVGLRLRSGEIDLRKSEEIDAFFNDINKGMSHKPELYHMKKEYSKAKAEEVYFLLKNGATVTNDKLFKNIDALIEK